MGELPERCPYCGSGRLLFHGYYRRYASLLIDAEEDEVEEVESEYEPDFFCEFVECAECGKRVASFDEPECLLF